MLSYMRKLVSIKYETESWHKLKIIALTNSNTVEDEANIMLENYLKENVL